MDSKELLETLQKLRDDYAQASLDLTVAVTEPSLKKVAGMKPRFGDLKKRALALRTPENLDVLRAASQEDRDKMQALADEIDKTAKQTVNIIIQYIKPF